jgi:hypothetical protein
MEENLDPSSVPPEPPVAIFRHAFGISSLLSLFFAVLLILTYGTKAGFRAIRFLFLLSISAVHLLSIMQPFLKGLPSDKPVARVLFLSRDVHYFTVFLLFTAADLTPILCILNYVILLSLALVSYAVTDILPLTGRPPGDAVAQIQAAAAHPAATNVPIGFEIALAVQLFIVAVVEFTAMKAIVFVAYIVWFAMFNYATSRPHHHAWTAIGRWFAGITEMDHGTLGTVVEWVIDGVGRLGTLAIAFYA